MIVALTGSTGFLGRHLVPLLVAHGHQVVALVRAGSALPESDATASGSVRAVVAELHDEPALTAALRGCDVVIHASSALSGDETTQQTITVQGTEHVLRAMVAAGLKRLIGLSSLSVYGWDHLACGDVLDESTPLETRAEQRDVYARCKLQQDQLFTAFGGVNGNAVVVLRPGIFYGPRAGNDHPAAGLWNFAMGQSLGRQSWLLMGPTGHGSHVPLVHVADVSSAVVSALQVFSDPTFREAHVFNLVEDPVPCRHELLSALRTVGPATRVFEMPWPVHLWLAKAAFLVAGLVPGARNRLPGLLRPLTLWARFAPVRFDGSRARQVLGWKPKHQVLRDLRG